MFVIFIERVLEHAWGGAVDGGPGGVVQRAGEVHVGRSALTRGGDHLFRRKEGGRGLDKKNVRL